MVETKILLCCGAGMSSGFLASRARKAAKKRKMPVACEARSQSEVMETLGSYDILMIGPHLSGDKPVYDSAAAPYGMPVVVIPVDIYSQLDGDRLIDLAVSTLSEQRQG